jgi:hypothetical protein
MLLNLRLGHPLRVDRGLTALGAVVSVARKAPALAIMTREGPSFGAGISPR